MCNNHSIEDLISAIMDRPPIWMSKHPHHKNRKVIKKMWDQICGLMPENDADYLKKRWKNLKDHYRKELKKYGDVTDDNSGSQWKYFEQMSFLKDEVFHSKDESSSSFYVMNSDGENEDGAFPCFRSNANEMKATFTNIQPSSSPTASSSSAYSSESLKRKTANEFLSAYKEYNKKRLNLQESDVCNSYNDSIKVSDDYHYLMSILPQMKMFTLCQKLRVRNRINEVLMEEISRNEQIKVETM